MNEQPANLTQKLELIVEHWRPRVVAQVDDYYVKLVKFQGEFVWHEHDEQDELFLVLDGEFTIKMRDGDVHLGKGELFVVPRGVEHCPAAAEEASVLLLERRDTDQTGGVESALRAESQEWI